MNLLARFLLEGERSLNGPLSPQERDHALRTLESLPTIIDLGGLQAVACRDLGFRTDGPLVVHGMKPAHRRFFRRMEISPGDVKYSQDSVPVAGLMAYTTGKNVITGSAGERWAELPEAVFNTGTEMWHVYSGHTRLGAQMLAGRHTVTVNAIKYDSDADAYQSV